MHQQFLLQQPVIPLGFGFELGQEIRDPLLDGAIHHLLRLAAQLLPAVERERAQRVDHLALLVHDVVVFQQPLAGLEVLQLDALLRRLDRPRDERVREHLAFLGPHAIHQLCDAVRAEQPHQVVLERQEELRGPRVALPAGTAAQLPVDAPRLVAFRPDDVEAAEFVDIHQLAIEILDLRRFRDRDAGAEFDVGTAAGHVRRDRDRPRLTGASHNLRFALVVLRVQHVMHESRALEHARQRLGHLHARGTHQHRVTQVVKPAHFLDDRVVLLATRLEDHVLPVVADDRPVRRDDRDFQLVDLVELRLLRLGGTRHARQLLVHAEVILDRDGCERLRFALDLHGFLGFHCLVQPLGPAPPRHRASGELVDDQDLPVLHDVVHVLLVQRVGPQQLVHDVELLALHRVLGLEFAACLDLFLRRQLLIVIDAMNARRDIRQYELLVIGRRHQLDATIGQVHGMPLLVEDVEEVVLQVTVLLLRDPQLPVGEVVELHPLHELLDALLLERLQEALVLRASQPRLVQRDASPLFVALLEQPFPFGDQRIRHLGLPPHHALDRRVMLREHRIVLVAHRARDDERRPRLVDQDRVDLVDDREPVGALHPLLERDHHVVAQVVEAELVVGAVGDVALVGRPPLRRSGLRVVEASDGHPQVPVDVTHPLRVATGEVRVHRHQVRALAGQRVEVQRQCGDQRLSLTGGHFRDAAEVQLDAADQLDIVMDHVPRQLAAGDQDGRAQQPAGGFAHRRKCFRQDLVQRVADDFTELPFEATAPVGAAHLVIQRLAVRRVPRHALLFLQVRDPPLDVVRALMKDRAKPGRLAPEVSLGERLQSLTMAVDLVDDRLHALPLTLVA